MPSPCPIDGYELTLSSHLIISRFPMASVKHLGFYSCPFKHLNSRYVKKFTNPLNIHLNLVLMNMFRENIRLSEKWLKCNFKEGILVLRLKT